MILTELFNFLEHHFSCLWNEIIPTPYWCNYECWTQRKPSITIGRKTYKLYCSCMTSKYINTKMLQNWICIRALLQFHHVCVFKYHPHLKKHTNNVIKFFSGALKIAPYGAVCTTESPEAIVGVNYRAQWTWRKKGPKPLCWKKKWAWKTGSFSWERRVLSLWHTPHPFVLSLTHQEAIHF